MESEPINLNLESDCHWQEGRYSRGSATVRKLHIKRIFSCFPTLKTQRK
jgi:hypothetical protein